jgi:hypothetical protein
VFRAESLRAVGGVRSEIPPSFQRWDAVNAVMAAGWVAVRYPEQLVRHAPAPDGSALRDDGDERIGRARARRRMLERVPDAVAAGAPDLILHGEFLALEAVSRPPVPPPRLTLASLPPNERLAWALAVVRDLAAHGVARPGRAMRWVAPHVVRAARRLLRLLSAPAAAS